MRLLPLTAIRSIRSGGVETRLRSGNLLALMITLVNLLGIVATLFVYVSLHGTLDERSGQYLLQSTRDDYRSFEPLERGTRDTMAAVRRLEASVELDSSEKQVVAYVDLLIGDEDSYQLFLRLLKVNVYHLAGQIPGAASWYEIYGPEIDQLIERSRSRQLQLLEIKQFYGDA